MKDNPLKKYHLDSILLETSIGDIYALSTCLRVDRGDLPQGLYSYDLRESDDGEGVASIEPYVGVNHFETIITDYPLDFGEEGYITVLDWSFGEDEGLSDAMKRYLSQ